MTTTHDTRRPARREDSPAGDRRPAVRDQHEEADQTPGLRAKMADGGWQLYAIEVVVLLIVFGWMALTNLAAGGHGPL